jgi:hypothetical protein
MKTLYYLFTPFRFILWLPMWLFDAVFIGKPTEPTFNEFVFVKR